MQRVLHLPSIHHVSAYVEKILSWAVALLLPVATYTLLIRLAVYFMELLYEIFIRYQY
ncbi:hypothetical protein SAMN05660461_1027 [Chitinophaga ginsengisegetis]|uniref:Uncharacterized protein n=1 Tax=Chitinophaga ginsengisegetis TaxID=393003 RepID=A0A1T5NCD8_9BACT|nr:hypothetical protein [Chitinophaga ginsengisegetis]SKC97859.1 hypothetical protein SAMN05660461_1027 [Chitinophaga ginsengisegetis]